MNLTQSRGYTLGFVLIIIAMLLLFSNTFAQGWRGIVPIHSTCQEVERELGGNACGKKSATYNLPDETVTFIFAKDGCNEKWYGEHYNISTGTLVGISVLPKVSKRLTIADLSVELSKFQKAVTHDGIDVFKYISREVGMYFTALEDGQVLDVTYIPAASYDNLRCSPSTEPNPLDKLKVLGTPSIKIGSYDPASLDQESQLFCKLIQKLEEFSSRKGGKGPEAMVYVIVYARQGAQVDEAKKIAEQVRGRLVTKYKIDTGKVFALDGGYRPDTVVELFIQPYGTNAPEPTLTPRPNKRK